MKEVIQSLIGDYWKNITIAILLIVILASCGAVKKKTSKISEETKIEKLDSIKTIEKDTSNIKKTEQTKVDDKTKTVVKKTTWEPVDPTKPASTIEPDGTKTNLNNVKKIVEETIQSNDVKTDNSKNYEESKKSEKETKSESQTKTEINKDQKEIDLDKKQWNPWSLIWVLIPIGIMIFIWRKYFVK